MTLAERLRLKLTIPVGPAAYILLADRHSCHAPKWTRHARSTGKNLCAARSERSRWDDPGRYYTTVCSILVYSVVHRLPVFHRPTDYYEMHKSIFQVTHRRSKHRFVLTYRTKSAAARHQNTSKAATHAQLSLSYSCSHSIGRRFAKVCLLCCIFKPTMQRYSRIVNATTRVHSLYGVTARTLR